MDISVTLAGKKLDVPILNGAGTVKTIEHVEKMAQTKAGGIVVGSATVEPREGRGAFRPFHDGTLNSMDLPNPGLMQYRRDLPVMCRIAHDRGKVLHFSIAGNTPEEYAELACVAAESQVDCLEINTGCPSIFDDNRQPLRIISFLPDLVGSILFRVRQKAGRELQLSVKVSYFSDRKQLTKLAYVFKHCNLGVSAVVTTNSIPNCLDFAENGTPLLVPELKGYCGGAGKMILPLALGQVQMWREELSPSIQVVGIGGISCGLDAVKHFWAGADAVQVTSALLMYQKLEVQPLNRIIEQFEGIAPIVPRFAKRVEAAS
jgi:dihydroorotate dehydrogenase